MCSCEMSDGDGVCGYRALTVSQAAPRALVVIVDIPLFLCSLVPRRGLSSPSSSFRHKDERAADAGCQVNARAEFQTLRKLSIPKIRSAKIASESAALPGGPFLCKGSV